MSELKKIDAVTEPGFEYSDSLSEFDRDHILADRINDLVDAVEELQGMLSDYPKVEAQATGAYSSRSDAARALQDDVAELKAMETEGQRHCEHEYSTYAPARCWKCGTWANEPERRGRDAGGVGGGI